MFKEPEEVLATEDLEFEEGEFEELAKPKS